MSQQSISIAQVGSRIAAAILGGYAFTWGLMALGVALLFAAGMEFHDAESLGYIVGFLVYLVVFLWAFASRTIDPRTGELLPDDRLKVGSQFFYPLHYSLTLH